MLCYYLPAGNVIHQPVFERGIVCTDCDGVPCSKVYIGLCGKFTNLENCAQSKIILLYWYLIKSLLFFKFLM